MGEVKVKEGTQMHSEVKKLSFGQGRNHSKTGRGRIRLRAERPSREGGGEPESGRIRLQTGRQNRVT